MALRPPQRNGADIPCPSRFRPRCEYTAAHRFVRRWKAPMFWKTGRQPGLSHVRGQGGPRLRVGTKRLRDGRPEWQSKPGGGKTFERARSSRRRPTLGRQSLRRRRRRCRSAGAMASATGHRFRNLWPDRQESPGHPGGSGHRSKSRDRKKSLLRRGYARLVPCSMVRKGSTVRVRQRAFPGFPGILPLSWA